MEKGEPAPIALPLDEGADLEADGKLSKTAHALAKAAGLNLALLAKLETAEMRRLLTKAAQAGFTPQEKHQFKVDATFLNSNPLRINRIMNVYNFYRTVQTHLGVDEDVTQEQELAGLLRTAGHNNREHTQLRFRAVLHRWVVLTEQWPFRGDVGAADVGRREAARWCRGAARRQCTRKDSRTGAWDGAQ